MIKLIAAVLLMQNISMAAIPSYDDLKKKVYKIETVKKEKDGSDQVVAMATGFFVDYNNENYFVTNNHVCNGFYNTKPRLIKRYDERGKEPKDFYHVKSVYMGYGADVCIIKTVEKVEGFKISDREPTYGDNITMVGYSGYLYGMHVLKGSVFDYTNYPQISKFVDCNSSDALLSDEVRNHKTLMCRISNKYGIYKKGYMLSSTLNVSPGHSGSVLLFDDGTVAGVLAMRRGTDATTRTNGDGLFFKNTEIISAIKEAKFMSVDGGDLKNLAKLRLADDQMREFEEYSRRIYAEVLSKIKEILE